MAYPPPKSPWHSAIPPEMYCEKCGWLLMEPNSELHSVNNKKDCPGEELEDRIQRTILGMAFIIGIIAFVYGSINMLVLAWENVSLTVALLGLLGFYLLFYFGHKLGKKLNL